MKKRAVGYCRISTLMQVDNTSLKDQEDKIRMYAKLHDIVIDEMFIDKAVSGKSTDRPEYDKMMDYVKENNIDNSKEVSTIFFSSIEDFEEYKYLANSYRTFIALKPYINKQERLFILPKIGNELDNILNDLGYDTGKANEMELKLYRTIY